MDPVISRIGVCNSKITRYSLHAAHSHSLDHTNLETTESAQRELAEQSLALRSLPDRNTDMFVRYLLRNIDFEERIVLMKLSAEIDEYMEVVNEIHALLASSGYLAQPHVSQPHVSQAHVSQPHVSRPLPKYTRLEARTLVTQIANYMKRS
jgi:hypothetical protein